MKRMTEEEIERIQIEEVFHLHGELDDKPVKFPDAWKDDGERVITWPDGVPPILLSEATQPGQTFHYTYDGHPEWASEDFEWGAETFTVVRDVMFGLPPLVLEDANGLLWLRTRDYLSSGEIECPFRDWDSDGLNVKPPNKVTRRTAQLDPKPAHRVQARWYGDDRPNARTARCPYCEARIGEEHGYIYLGDGWAEVVYQSTGKFARDSKHPTDGTCDCEEETPDSIPMVRMVCGNTIVWGDDE